MCKKRFLIIVIHAPYLQWPDSFEILFKCNPKNRCIYYLGIVNLGMLCANKKSFCLNFQCLYISGGVFDAFYSIYYSYVYDNICKLSKSLCSFTLNKLQNVV